MRLVFDFLEKAPAQVSPVMTGSIDPMPAAEPAHGTLLLWKLPIHAV